MSLHPTPTTSLGEATAQAPAGTTVLSWRNCDKGQEGQKHRTCRHHVTAGRHHIQTTGGAQQFRLVGTGQRGHHMVSGPRGSLEPQNLPPLPSLCQPGLRSRDQNAALKALALAPSSVAGEGMKPLHFLGEPWPAVQGGSPQREARDACRRPSHQAAQVLPLPPQAAEVTGGWPDLWATSRDRLGHAVLYPRGHRSVRPRAGL